jgi:hypothetical protein
MFDHMLNPAKGWPNQAALDFQARISANVTFLLNSGNVAHLNSAGELEAGVNLGHMPLFMFQGAGDLDVNPTGGTSGPFGSWTPISPSGRVMCLPGSGPYELETTEFDTTKSYLPGDLLYAPTGNTSGTSGVLTNDGTFNTGGALYTSTMNAVVGVVSRGAFTNAYGKLVLAFWPAYLPGRQ